jgi:hypothetical protein
MKIAEVVVGTAGEESTILHPDVQARQAKRPPQVGYTVKIGPRRIPTPGYADNDAKGVNGSMVPS